MKHIIFIVWQGKVMNPIFTDTSANVLTDTLAKTPVTHYWHQMGRNEMPKIPRTHQLNTPPTDKWGQAGRKKYHKCQFVTKFRSSNLEKTQFFRKKWSSIIRKTDLKFCCHVSKSYWSIIWLFIFNKIKLYTSFNMWYIFSLIRLASTFSFKAFFWEIYWLLTSNKQHATKSY